MYHGFLRFLSSSSPVLYRVLHRFFADLVCSGVLVVISDGPTPVIVARKHAQKSSTSQRCIFQSTSIYVRKGKRMCSVWTVDLAHLLSNHGCLVSFLTVTVGTNPEYASERFYARNIQSDKFRVERLFQQAQQAGISISVRSVSWQELRDLLIGGTLHPTLYYTPANVDRAFCAW